MRNEWGRATRRPETSATEEISRISLERIAKSHVSERQGGLRRISFLTTFSSLLNFGKFPRGLRTPPFQSGGYARRPPSSRADCGRLSFLTTLSSLLTPSLISLQPTISRRRYHATLSSSAIAQLGGATRA